MANAEDNQHMSQCVPLEHDAVIPNAQSPLRSPAGEFADVSDATFTQAVQRGEDAFARCPIKVAQIALCWIGNDVRPAVAQPRRSRFAAIAEIAPPRR